MDQKSLLNTLYQLSVDNPRNSSIQNLFLDQAMSYLNPQTDPVAQVLQSFLGGGANTATTVPTGQREAMPTYSDLLGGAANAVDTGTDVPDELYQQYQASLNNAAGNTTGEVKQTSGIEKFLQNLPGVSDVGTLFSGLGAEATNPGTGALQYLLTNRPQNILGGISYGLNKLLNPNQLAQMEALYPKQATTSSGYINTQPANIYNTNNQQSYY